MSKQRAKGTRGENDAVACFHAHGLTKVERRAQAGSNDKGDLINVPFFAVEVKSVKEYRLSEFMDEAQAEKLHAGEPHAMVIIKRPRKPMDRAFCITELGDQIEFIKYVSGLVKTIELLQGVG